MKRDKITRKKFLAHAGMLGFGTVVGSSLLGACSGPSGQSEQQTEATVPPPVEEENGMADAEPMGDAADACNDLTGLTEVELKQREQLQYVAQSTKPENLCSNCRFWQPENYESPCGGCQLLKGPVHPNGWCQTWAPMQS